MKSGGEHALRPAQSFLDVEEIPANFALSAIGEDEAKGRAGERSGNDEPRDEELLFGDLAAHENDENRNGNGKNLSGEELADPRGGGNRSGFGALPGDGEEDEEEVGAKKDEVTPTGKTGGSMKGDEVYRIGENGEEKDGTKNKGEGAQPGGRRSTGAQEEGERENEVADNVESEDLAEDSGLIGLPASGGVEEEEIESDGEDGELEEVQDGGPIEGRRGFVGARKEDHENGGGPDEKEDVRRPGSLRGVWDEALVVSTDNLSEGFQSKGEGEEEPELARVGGRSASDEATAECGPKDNAEVERIGNEKVLGGVMNQKQIKE